MTPMMQQYQAVKDQYPDAILFYRLGDFYEMFFDDAIEASRLLQITLTARNKGEHKTPMCGVPYHAANNYIAKLTRLGRKVAICEQLSDPNLLGIVQRDVVRVITPGTTLDESILDQKTNNYLLAITVCSGGYDLAYADISTGEFLVTAATDMSTLRTEIERVSPAEILIPEFLWDDPILSAIRKHFTHIAFFSISSSDKDETAGNALTRYLQTTQKTALTHLRAAEKYEPGSSMVLDEATLKNLEILSTLRENKREGSLLWVLDETITSMGGRFLRHALIHPMLDKNIIEQRLNAIDEFVQKQALLEDVRSMLKNILDMERLSSRLSLGHGNARDLVGLKNSLQVLPQLKNFLVGAQSDLLVQNRNTMDVLADMVELIEKAIVAEPPIGINDGGMIAQGYCAELDELKNISTEGKNFIQQLQIQEIERTGISTLKIRYNSVFGYYIEVSKGQSKNVPENYIRKQTLVNAERYITPELKEFEEKVLGAEEKIVAIEHRIFLEIREKIVVNISRIQKTAAQIALIDHLSGLAFVALKNRYCRPQIHNDGDIRIEEGRHPVVEKMSSNGRFIPNDTILNHTGEQLLLITGPNMGGKSTYLRQVALIVLMAQVGSFVPAKSADICLVDRIFTRVGASDNLVRGQSTFMVEMQETANILDAATEKSLVILDEIGRGTSTYDGMSIAWAIMEYLHDKLTSKTLFATHYHELISLADKLQHAANYSVAVKDDSKDGVVFLYKILRGGVDKSYGIEVAKLAGLPDEVIAKARKILVDLEEGVLESGIQHELQTTRPVQDQVSLFEREHSSLKAVADEVKKIDVNSLTPLDALQKLHQIKIKLTQDHANN
jgi:DNA mismatch repair protein MutS